MSASAVPRRRALILVPLLLIVLLAWWTVTRTDSEAATPSTLKAASTSQAGKITFDSLPGPVTSTLALRSFSAGGTNTSGAVGGGGGSGKFVPEDPTAVVDASGVDPLLLRAATTGVHLPTVTVSLYAPGTTKRQEVWAFANVTISAMRTAQSGSAKAPRVSLGLHYTRVTMTTYDTKGAVVRSTCFDLGSNTIC